MKVTYYILVALCITSCSMRPSLEYQFSDQEQPIACDASYSPLLNEALHSFEADILKHNPAELKTQVAAYGQFMFKGMAGTAAYKDIASTHSLAIRDQLIAENILLTNGTKSNLNYEHPAVTCLIDNVEDADLKRTLNALLQTNSMDPAMFNSRLRNFGRQAAKNRYQSAYIALDSYYQNLVGLSLDTTAND